MAAKSDGAAASLPSETPSRCLPSPEQCPPRFQHARRHYSLLDCCWVLCALMVFFTDGATDLWLAADYYLRRDYGWFVLTLAFVVVPSTVVQVLSFRWFIYDYSEMDGGGDGGAPAAEAVGTDVPGGGDFSTRDSVRRGAGGAAGDDTLPGVGGASNRPSSCCRACMWIFQSVVHILQLGQVWRYLHALYLGAQSRWRGGRERQHFYLRMLFESADVSMLRLLESFLKSAPQLVLQLSIMVHSQRVLPLQGLSASASLVSLAWMMASYQKVLRDSRDDKAPMSYKAAVVQMLWHLFSIGARAAAFALFASVFQLYFGIFVVAHWCLMTFWIIQGETDFCMSKWEEIVYNMMVGIVYVFCWFNVREGGARCRLLTYCTVELAENAALTALWYLHRGPFTSDFCALLVLCVVACSQALGTFFMLVYYCLLHPDGHAQWGCIRGGADESCDTTPQLGVETAITPAPPPDVIARSPPRTLPRTTGAEGGDKDGVLPIFQVRPGPAPCAPAALHTPRMEGPVIRIDLPRKKYPAWDAHFIDRRLRKTILMLESTSPSTPRLQYRSLTSPKEVTEYETTV
ncbi:XK-related protein 7-like [Brienomyrus brachyistius]|uniref:XK-related protein 7-like n=1 Tax=Brienomyrus brachyistius TaxID=42636 RepID=UPI0020B2EFDB|nr:XK-related protein 7-like [Brienomyrus brachyistius]